MEGNREIGKLGNWEIGTKGNWEMGVEGRRVGNWEIGTMGNIGALYFTNTPMFFFKANLQQERANSVQQILEHAKQ